MPESIDNTLNKVRSYRENPAINQSYLKNLVLPRIYKEESALFAKGDYIDMALTYPEIDLREHFAISNVNRPSDTIIAICQKLDPLIEKIQDIEDLKDFITEDMLGDYYQNRSLESRIKSFLEAGKEWLKFRIENKGKQFLTEKEVENVLNGQDYYFDSEEIAERLEAYTEFQKKKFEAELEAFQKEQEDDIEGVYVKPKKKKILPS